MRKAPTVKARECLATSLLLMCAQIGSVAAQNQLHRDSINAVNTRAASAYQAGDSASVRLAIRLWSRYYVAIRQSGRASAVGTALNNIGLAYRRLHSLDSALHYFRQALASYSAVNHRSNQAVALYNIGLVFQGRERTDSTLFYFERALALAKRTEDKTLVRIIENGIRRMR